MTLAEFFAGHPASRQIFAVLHATIAAPGLVDWAWIPGRLEPRAAPEIGDQVDGWPRVAWEAANHGMTP